MAIIDEIQMMRDTGRGWAWTRALLGVMAEEVHVCGEEGAIELVQSLLSTTGEDIEVSAFLLTCYLKLQTGMNYIMKKFSRTEEFCVLCAKWCIDLCAWLGTLLKF